MPYDFEVLIVFNEAVTDFNQDDIMIGGDSSAKISRFSGTGGTYTIEIEFTSSGYGDGDGTLTINLPVDAVQDSQGLGNIAYSSEDDFQNLSVFFHSRLLEIIVPSGVQNSQFDVTFKFNEPMRNFPWDEWDTNIRQTGLAEVSDHTGEDGGTNYTLTITPIRDGGLYVRIPPASTELRNVANDLKYGGRFTAGAELDITPPEVSISGVPTTVQTGAFKVSIAFTEDVTEFDGEDIELSGVDATVTSFTGSGREYTAEITPTTEGELVIRVPADAAEDTATNGNEVSDEYRVPVDPVRPTVTIDVPSGPQSIVFEATIEFSESVTGFAASDINFTGTGAASASVTNLTGGDGASEYVAEVTSTSNGTVTLQVPENVAQDAATNENEASLEYTVSIDVTLPGVTLTVPITPQNAAFAVPIAFTENVTGFEASDISLTGTATATFTLIGSGAEYTAKSHPQRVLTVRLLSACLPMP